jgi:hypothetical protein
MCLSSILANLNLSIEIASIQLQLMTNLRILRATNDSANATEHVAKNTLIHHSQVICVEWQRLVTQFQPRLTLM